MEDADAKELYALPMRSVLLERPLHVPPVPELEGDPRRPAVHVEHLDGEAAGERRQERRHAGLERLLVRVVDAVLRRQGGEQERVVASDGRQLLPGQKLQPCVLVEYHFLPLERSIDGWKCVAVSAGLTVGACAEFLGVDALLVLRAHLVDKLHLPGLQQPLHLLFQRPLGPYL